MAGGIPEGSWGALLRADEVSAQTEAPGPDLCHFSMDPGWIQAGSMDFSTCVGNLILYLFYIQIQTGHGQVYRLKKLLQKHWDTSIMNRLPASQRW